MAMGLMAGQGTHTRGRRPGGLCEQGLGAGDDTDTPGLGTSVLRLQRELRGTAEALWCYSFYTRGTCGPAFRGRDQVGVCRGLVWRRTRIHVVASGKMQDFKQILYLAVGSFESHPDPPRVTLCFSVAPAGGQEFDKAWSRSAVRDRRRLRPWVGVGRAGGGRSGPAAPQAFREALAGPQGCTDMACGPTWRPHPPTRPAPLGIQCLRREWSPEAPWGVRGGGQPS